MSRLFDQIVGGKPRQAEHFPTRNGPLNMWLDGGLPYGGLTVLSGDAQTFKSTMLIEAVAEAQRLGFWQLVFDREAKMTADRLTQLGANPDHPGMVYFDNEETVLTIERVFEKSTEWVAKIRTIELKDVIQRLKEKGNEELVARYRKRLQASHTATGTQLSKMLHSTGSEPTYYYNLLAPEDKTPILWVLDSITGTPARSQLAGDKIESKVEAKVEIQIRSAEAGSNTIGQSARAWSEAFKRVTFIDSKVIAIATSQMRLSGFGSYTGPYNKAAHPNAVEFAATLHIQTKASGGKASYVVRGNDGSVHFKSTPPKPEDTHSTVGRRITLSIRKLSSSSSRSIPCFFLNATGTDVIHTAWDYFTDVGALVVAGGGRYKVPESAQDKIEEEGPTTVTRGSFEAEDYIKYINYWAALMRLSKDPNGLL